MPLGDPVPLADPGIESCQLLRTVLTSHPPPLLDCERCQMQAMKLTGRPALRSVGGRSAGQDLAVTQFDQAGFDAAPLGKPVPAARAADAVPRYVQRPTGGTPMPANGPSRRLQAF